MKECTATADEASLSNSSDETKLKQIDCGREPEGVSSRACCPSLPDIFRDTNSSYSCDDKCNKNVNKNCCINQCKFEAFGMITDGKIDRDQAINVIAKMAEMNKVFTKEVVKVSISFVR